MAGMLVDYTKLFAPYTRDGHTLENSIRYWQKVAAQRGCSEESLAVAMHEVFTEIEEGRQFPMDHCPCGCGIDKAATALVHEIRDRMLAIDAEARAEFARYLSERNQAAVVGHLNKINDEYEAEHLCPTKEKMKIAWRRQVRLSPSARIGKRAWSAFSGLVRSLNTRQLPGTDTD